MPAVEQELRPYSNDDTTVSECDVPMATNSHDEPLSTDNYANQPTLRRSLRRRNKIAAAAQLESEQRVTGCSGSEDESAEPRQENKFENSAEQYLEESVSSRHETEEESEEPHRKKSQKKSVKRKSGRQRKRGRGRNHKRSEKGKGRRDGKEKDKKSRKSTRKSKGKRGSENTGQRRKSKSKRTRVQLNGDSESLSSEPPRKKQRGKKKKNEKRKNEKKKKEEKENEENELFDLLQSGGRIAAEAAQSEGEQENMTPQQRAARRGRLRDRRNRFVALPQYQRAKNMNLDSDRQKGSPWWHPEHEDYGAIKSDVWCSDKRHTGHHTKKKGRWLRPDQVDKEWTAVGVQRTFTPQMVLTVLKAGPYWREASWSCPCNTNCSEPLRPGQVYTHIVNHRIEGTDELVLDRLLVCVLLLVCLHSMTCVIMSYNLSYNMSYNMSYIVVVVQPKSTHHAIYMHCVCKARSTKTVVQHCLSHLDHGCTRTVTGEDGHERKVTTFIITPPGLKDSGSGVFQPAINEEEIQSRINQELANTQSTANIICRFAVGNEQSLRLHKLKESPKVIGGSGCCL